MPEVATGLVRTSPRSCREVVGDLELRSMRLYADGLQDPIHIGVVRNGNLKVKGVSVGHNFVLPEGVLRFEAARKPARVFNVLPRLEAKSVMIVGRFHLS